jgi:hypothetical protein
MAVPQPPNVTPYSANSTDASWKAAKSDKTRDKWHTELGEALRDAKAAYDKVKFYQLDVALIMAKTNQKFDIVKDVEIAKIGAMKHYTVAVKPAIKALEKAHSKAVWAGRNVVITQGANTKAKQIAADLRTRLAQLKGIDFDDFDAEIARLKRNMKFTHDNFATNMTRVLSDAAQFVAKVRQTPTPKVFNKGIENAARGLTQMIGQSEKLKKNGHDLGKTNPQAIFDQLDDWANSRDKLDDNANRVTVMAAIARFELLADAVDDWWN